VQQGARLDDAEVRRLGHATVTFPSMFE